MRVHGIELETTELVPGMFVAELDRPWVGTPFLIQGFLIENEHQVRTLRKLCSRVVIDPVRSNYAKIEHLAPLFVERKESEPDARSAANRERPKTLIYNSYIEPDSPAPLISRTVGRVNRMRVWFDEWVAPVFRAPMVPQRASRRVPSIFDHLPQGIDFVEYRNQRPVEQEIERATDIYREADNVMETLSRDFELTGEIAVDTVTGTVDLLVESIVANPDALMWLTVMQEQNARAYNHGVKVGIYMLSLGRHLGFPPSYLTRLGMIGLLLDLGKIRINTDILDKPGPLEPNEREEVRRHVRYGLEVLAQSRSIDEETLEGIAQHHERIDGTGYPGGLVGDAISVYGRMAAIADTFAALTSQRPYAVPLAPYDSIRILFANSGKLFHEPLVEQFVQAIGIFPVGTLVELSTGEVAAVVSHNRIRRLQPRVVVLTDIDKRPLGLPRELDLLTSPHDRKGLPIRITRGLPAGAFGLDPRKYFVR